MLPIASPGGPIAPAAQTGVRTRQKTPVPANVRGEGQKQSGGHGQLLAVTWSSSCGWHCIKRSRKRWSALLLDCVSRQAELAAELVCRIAVSVLLGMDPDPAQGHQAAVGVGP